MPAPVLVAVNSVKALKNEPEGFNVNIDYTHYGEAIEDAPYISRPNDDAPLNLQIREWLANNPHTVIPAE